MTAPTAGLVAGAATLRALDEAYRAALARTSIAVVRAMLADWATVNARDLAGTSDRWLGRSVDLTLAGQRNAVGLANAYTAQVRRLSVPNAPLFTPPPPASPNAEQVRNSFEFTAIKTAARELGKAKTFAEQQRQTSLDPSGFEVEDSPAGAVPERQIMQAAIARASGAAVRHVTTAGRDQLEANVRADAVAIGWYRTTKAGCCYFCAMLASRGLVYKEESFKVSNAQFKGVGEQKVHDRCGCGLRPVYTEDDELPERTAEFSQLWADRAKGSGPEAVYNFRLAYEGRVAPRKS